MKKRILSFIVLTVCLWLSQPVWADWTLVWQDEFESSVSDDWTFEEGMGSSGWGNNELQYYREENASVVDGMLQIQAKIESYGDASYTSARMKTQGIQSFQYGKIEARISMPSFTGVWPAFWMLGESISTDGWPYCGEIDIMEHVNTESTVYGTAHWYDEAYASYSGNTSVDVTGFHVYSIEWDEEYIRWYVDDTQYHEMYIADGVNGTDELHKEFFILLNMAIGGNWPGFTIDESAMPANMLVDYVRVYEESDVSDDDSSDDDSSGETGVSGLSGTYYLENYKSGLVMDVYYGGTDDGVNILQYTNGGTTNQQFILNEVSTGVYSIINVNSGKAVDVAGCSTANNANIQQWTYTGADCQHFSAISTGDGYYEFKAVHSDKIIEVVNGSTEENANISQFTDNDQICGRWALVAVDGSETTSWSTTIEAEDYSSYSGVEIEDCDEGGENVGYIETGDWMAYTGIEIPYSGTYTVSYRVASESTGGQLSLDYSSGSVVVDYADIPVTGDWQTWTTVSNSISLDAGTYDFGIYAQEGGWNFNWFSLTYSGTKSTNNITNDNIDYPAELSVYPVPATDVLYISGLKETSNVQILDIQGKVLLSTSINSSTDGINVSQLDNGVFFVRIFEEGIPTTLRFIK